MHRLDLLAGELRRGGIRRVTGHVVGVDTWFDAKRGVAGWRRSFFGNESPPLSALVVDRAQRNDHPVASAALAAAAQFAHALWAHGIQTRGAVARAAHPHAATLATMRSRQLWRLLQFMDRDSATESAVDFAMDLADQLAHLGCLIQKEARS